MSGLRSDLSYIFRGLRRSPAFALGAVLSLAIGIGANAALFGVVRTLLLSPLPVGHAEELRLLGWSHEGRISISQTGSASYHDPETGASLRSNFNYSLYEALRQTPSGADVFAFAFIRGVSVGVDDRPAFFAGGALADDRYFPVLRVRMVLGRPLTEADNAVDAPLVVVLSHAFWMRAFGGDAAILGRSIRLNGAPAEVVGVTAPGFKGLSMGGFFPQTDVTVPLLSQPRVVPRMGGGVPLFSAEDQFWLRLMARVPEGREESAREALDLAMRATAPQQLTPEGQLPELRLVDGSQGAQPVRDETARLLWFLLGVAAIVLLIACVNLASLMLARGMDRQREMAVRIALGGGRTRLMRQVLLEAAVLAGAGAAAGLTLAWVTRDFLRALLTGSLGSGAFGDLDMQVVFDPVVVGFGAALALLAALVTGLVPAVRLSTTDPMAWMKESASSPGVARITAGRVLIALQIAVSVPLIAGAGLFLRTVSNLGAIELGFEPRGVVTFQVNPAYTGRPDESHPAIYEGLLARVAAVPGVRSVTLVENAPLSGIVSNTTVEVQGERVSLYRNAVGPAFLETMGARLVSGRMPGLQDGPGAPVVGVVNQKAIAALFGGADPIGQSLDVFGEKVRIVGIINDMPYGSKRESPPATVYPSALQVKGFGGHHVVLRTDLPVERIEPLLRMAVAAVHPDLPLPDVRRQTEIIAQASARERVFAQLLTIFGAFALLLATIGLHGLTAYTVSRRTREIGIRVAVGARASQVLWLILRQTVILVAFGLAVGAPVSLAAAPVVESLLFGVAPSSPGTLALVALLLLAVALAAALAPALRAARQDPMEALRT